MARRPVCAAGAGRALPPLCWGVLVAVSFAAAAAAAAREVVPPADALQRQVDGNCVNAEFDRLGSDQPLPSSLDEFSPGRIRFLRPMGGGCLRGDPWLFGVQLADTKRLHVHFSGDSLCVDGNSCCGAATVSPEGSPTLNEMIVLSCSTNASLDATLYGGIFDNQPGNPSGNPLAGYSLLYLPYCTGDAFLGAQKGASYDVPGNAPGCSVDHVGSENARIALEWALSTFTSLESVVMSGASASGVGAVAFGAWTAHKLRKSGRGGNTRVAVLSDGAVGTFAPSDSWNIAAGVLGDVVSPQDNGAYGDELRGFVSYPEFDVRAGDSTDRQLLDYALHYRILLDRIGAELPCLSVGELSTELDAQQVDEATLTSTALLCGEGCCNDAALCEQESDASSPGWEHASTQLLQLSADNKLNGVYSAIQLASADFPSSSSSSAATSASSSPSILRSDKISEVASLDSFVRGGAGIHNGETVAQWINDSVLAPACAIDAPAQAYNGPEAPEDVTTVDREGPEDGSGGGGLSGGAIAGVVIGVLVFLALVVLLTLLVLYVLRRLRVRRAVMAAKGDEGHPLAGA